MFKRILVGVLKFAGKAILEAALSKAKDAAAKKNLTVVKLGE